jgi:protein arginine kinase
MKENNNLQSFFCKFKLWANNDNPVWLASTVNLFRNIEKFKFPVKLDMERRKQIVSLLTKDIFLLEPFKNSVLFKAEDLSSLEKEYLVEHFLSNQSFHSTGLGEAFIIDPEGETMITLNLQNHIQFEFIDTRSELENAWNHIVKLETALGKNISYSYSSKFGFLTADPTQCGTALSVTVFLQLSGLIHTEVIDDTLEKLVDETFVVTGIQGSPREIIGDVLAIQNSYTLGVTEENIISAIRTITTKLMVDEHAARSQIKKNSHPAIKDKISRAFGILIHSYQIEAVEALNAISLLKLGVDLGWLDGINTKQLNALFFNCRRAHLLCQYEDKISQEEIQHRRAQFIHQTLKEAKLTI